MSAIHYLGQTISARPGETVLQALLREGVEARHSCGRGSCHSCLLKLHEGRLDRLQPVQPSIERSDHFLPCICMPAGDINVGPPVAADLGVAAELVGRRELAPRLIELDISPLRAMDFRPGQHVYLHRPDGSGRPYSIVSQPDEDYFFRLQVRVHEHGALSRWLASAPIGQTLDLRGPFGSMTYQPDWVAEDLLLLATGSGVGAMLAVARDAVAQGHRGRIRAYFGVRDAAEVWFAAALDELRGRHPDFHGVIAVSRPSGPTPYASGRVTDLARAAPDPLAGYRLYACGHPDMVAAARILAVAAGIRREAIHVDPFDTGGMPEPADRQIIEALQPDPELWNAIGQSRGLRNLLLEFYRRVFADPRLSPFFSGMEVEYVAGKQYTFLADLLTGRRDFMGMMPYNAHHWMVISDDLFDHREALFEAVLRESGLEERLIRRWLVLHERFRASLVKEQPAGLWMDGAFQVLREHSLERMSIDAVCDGCGREIVAGESARYLHRIGHLHCTSCAALDSHTHAATHAA